MTLLKLLALLVLTQIGGYFELGPVPASITEGQSFKVTVTLETSAKKDLPLHLSGEGLMFEPQQLVIPQGEKVGTFRVTVGYLPDDRRPPLPLGRRLTVSSGRSTQVREFTVLPRYYTPPGY